LKAKARAGRRPPATAADASGRPAATAQPAAAAERDLLVRELTAQRRRVAELESQMEEMQAATVRDALARSYPSDAEIMVRCERART